jgi:hypothetical protein
MIGNATYSTANQDCVRLTAAKLTVILAPLFSKREVGRRNLHLPGEKSPQPLAAFLCVSFSAALCRVYSVMAGLFGQRSALAAPGSGFLPHLSSATRYCRKYRWRLSSLPGVTAMKSQNQSVQNSESNSTEDLDDSMPLTVDYFFVTVKRKCEDGKVIIGLPISPYFPTLDEARAFRDNCEVEGAYCLGGSFFPDDEAQAEKDRIMLFGSETEPGRTEALFYLIKESDA